jgi:hypothetical protein
MRILLDWAADRAEIAALLKRVTSVKALPDLANSWDLQAASLSDLLGLYNSTELLLSNTGKRTRRDLTEILTLGASAWALKRTFTLESRTTALEAEERNLVKVQNASLHTDRAILQDLKYVHKAVRANSLSNAQLELLAAVEQSLQRVLFRAHTRLSAAQDLVHQQLSPDLIHDSELATAFLALQQQLHKDGMMTIWDNHKHIFTQKVSWEVKNRQLTVVIPVPVVNKAAWPPFRLLKATPVPQLTQKGLRILETNTLLGIRSSESSFLVMDHADLSLCKRVAQLWICSGSFPQWANNQTSCTTALYMGAWEAAAQLCPPPTALRSPWLRQLNNTWLATAHSTPTLYTVHCPGKASAVVLEGVNAVKVGKQCSLSSSQVMVHSANNIHEKVDIHLPPILSHSHMEAIKALFRVPQPTDPLLPLQELEERINMTEHSLKEAKARRSFSALTPMDIMMISLAALALLISIIHVLLTARWARPVRDAMRASLNTCLRPLQCCLESLSSQVQSWRQRRGSTPPPPHNRRHRSPPVMRMSQLRQQNRSPSPVNTSEDSDPTGSRGPLPLPKQRQPKAAEQKKASRSKRASSSSDMPAKPTPTETVTEKLNSSPNISTASSMPALTSSNHSSRSSSPEPSDRELRQLSRAARQLRLLNEATEKETTFIRKETELVKAQTEQLRQQLLQRRNPLSWIPPPPMTTLLLPPPSPPQTEPANRPSTPPTIKRPVVLVQSERHPPPQVP